jgi:hypothetical protein
MVTLHDRDARADHGPPTEDGVRRTRRHFWLPVIAGIAVVLAGLGAVNATASTGPKLGVTPLALAYDGSHCTVITSSGQTCTVTVSNTGTSGALTWGVLGERDASNNSLDDATFAPAGGSLNPGKSVKVKITTKDCNTGAVLWAFFFLSTNGGGSRTVSLACG